MILFDDFRCLVSWSLIQLYFSKVFFFNSSWRLKYVYGLNLCEFSESVQMLLLWHGVMITLMSRVISSRMSTNRPFQIQSWTKLVETTPDLSNLLYVLPEDSKLNLDPPCPKSMLFWYYYCLTCSRILTIWATTAYVVGDEEENKKGKEESD